MLAVVHGFAVIAAITAFGAIAGRFGVLGENAKVVLNRTAFHIGVPALILVSLADTAPSQVFSLTLLALALAALTIYSVSLLAAAAMRRPRGEAPIAAMLASYGNAGYLGIPLSAQVLGSTTDVASLIVFQVLVLVPISIGMLASQSSPDNSAGRRVVSLIANPIIGSSGLGLLLTLTDVAPPPVVRDALDLLAALAVPAVLLAFGISLSARTSSCRTRRGDLVLVVLLKTVLMPALAYAVARWAFGANHHELLVVGVLAALPAAQNINTYAAAYRRGEALARDATLLSTVVSVPIIMVIVAVTGA